MCGRRGEGGGRGRPRTFLGAFGRRGEKTLVCRRGGRGGTWERGRGGGRRTREMGGGGGMWEGGVVLAGEGRLMLEVRSCGRR